MGTLSLSNIEKVSVGGNNQCCLADLAMSNSYATGGDSFDASQLPFTYIDSINLPPVVGSGAYTLSFDPTAQKVLAYQIQASITGGTVAPITAGTPSGGISNGQLQQSSAEALAVNPASGVSAAASGIPIAVVESVYVTAGGVTGLAQVIPAGQTPATGQCTYNPTTGVFQFLIADAVTAVVVTYVQRQVATQMFSGAPMDTHTHKLSGLTGSIAMAQVTATTDLHTVTDRVLIFGHN